jgi:hypothetical protein
MPHSAEDIAAADWAGLTVRVAWTLLREGLRIRPALLKDARDHVLYNLEPGLEPSRAEDWAEAHTLRFVARARKKNFEDPWKQDWSMPISPRWHRAMEHALTRLTSTLFKVHYGDGYSLDYLEKNRKIDRVALEAGRGGLREILRRAGCADGLPFDQWRSDRLDRLLTRLAAYSPGPCPAVSEVIDGQHRDHVARCTRCNRMFRLVRQEHISPAELVPPLSGARPSGAVKVLAVHFHPEGRQHREAVMRETRVFSFPVGEDLLCIDYSDPPPVHDLLVLAAEVGRPSRDHLRTVLVEAPGRFSGHGLIGPAVDRAEIEVRSRPWGIVDGLGDLPAPLPTPPSARRWWTGVAGLTIVCTLLSGFAFAPARPATSYPVEVEFTGARGGAWAEFKVDNLANISVFQVNNGTLSTVLDGQSPLAKAEFAVGDGAYRLHIPGTAAILASSKVPIDAQALVQASAKAANPVEDLRDRIENLDPTSDIHVWRK